MLTLKCEKKILFVRSLKSTVKVVYHKRDIYSYHQAFCFCISLRETISMHIDMDRVDHTTIYHYQEETIGPVLLSPNGVQIFPAPSGRIQIKIKPPNPMLSYLNFCGWRWDLRSNDPLRNKVNNLSQQRPVVRRCILSAVLLANSFFFSVHFFSFHVSHTDSSLLPPGDSHYDDHHAANSICMVTGNVNGERTD
jgi:hypothetical protein